MISATKPTPQGKIVTFYSYKGGTGRSMALANVAWILANAGKRVLTIDWDLEAPGLHRYFEPFLDDKNLEHSTGVIDFVRDFATAAVSKNDGSDSRWFEEFGDILAHAIPLNWEFPNGGVLHIVPAGKQDSAYGVRVNSFDWHDFYEQLGGGVLFEAVKVNLRKAYDFILIDSRTGVSDTSGICTLQMPDELVVCFTLNRQSVFGASAAARHAFTARHAPSGEPTIKIWPLATRVEASEKDRLEIATNIARARFSGLMVHLDPWQEETYWGEVPVSYEPYYAYTEVLSPFRDQYHQTTSMLARMLKLSEYLNGESLNDDYLIDESRMSEGLVAFTSHGANDFYEELRWLGLEYDDIRKRMPASNARTNLMTSIVNRAQILAGQRDAGTVGERLFSEATDGARIVGLALARKDPQRHHADMALSAIGSAKSAFEQFQGLVLLQRLISTMHPATAARFEDAITAQLGRTILDDDPSRARLAKQLLPMLAEISEKSSVEAPISPAFVGAPKRLSLIRVTPASSVIRYMDPDERHGPWVVTRGNHAVRLPKTIRIAPYPVTNLEYFEFVKSGGYHNTAFWTVGGSYRAQFLTSDKKSMGPANWANSETIPAGQEHHPVSSISFLEAKAFINWYNSEANGDEEWFLPTEDQWEFAARSEEGRIYPWGDVFDLSRCNSAEAGVNGTCPVTDYKDGASKFGCFHMAGNVWEFVIAEGTRESDCVLRGGSFKNDRFEVRSYLRLHGVPVTHRPMDFGFRLALSEAQPAAA
ncbi:KGGVGR-motif variant AAA ATPase [Rhizobium leguminosarum]